MNNDFWDKIVLLIAAVYAKVSIYIQPEFGELDASITIFSWNLLGRINLARLYHCPKSNQNFRDIT